MQAPTTLTYNNHRTNTVSVLFLRSCNVHTTAFWAERGASCGVRAGVLASVDQIWRPTRPDHTLARFRSTMLACVAPCPLISRQAAPVRRSASCRATGSSDGWTAVPARAVSAFAGAVLLAGAPLSALAIPQTSACATISCDDFDYSGKDLRAEYYTKVWAARCCTGSSRVGASVPCVQARLCHSPPLSRAR